jgi:hypothetical protein
MYIFGNWAVECHVPDVLWLTALRTIKMTLEDILIDEEDMRSAKKYGLEFIKCNQNSQAL